MSTPHSGAHPPAPVPGPPLTPPRGPRRAPVRALGVSGPERDSLHQYLHEVSRALASFAA